jgi:hypothetical protein
MKMGGVLSLIPHPNPSPEERGFRTLLYGRRAGMRLVLEPIPDREGL